VNSLFEKYPWLKNALISLAVLVLVLLAGWGINRIWYWNYDTTPKQGWVNSFYWERRIDEYHLETTSHSDWADEVDNGAYDKTCYPALRTVSVKQPDGTYKDVEKLDTYCNYKTDSWEIYKRFPPTSGTDRNPYYSSHPEDSTKVQYRELEVRYTVTFGSEYTLKSFSFNYDQNTWSQFPKEGGKVTIDVNRKKKVPFAPQPPR